LMFFNFCIESLTLFLFRIIDLNIAMINMITRIPIHTVLFLDNTIDTNEIVYRRY